MSLPSISGFRALASLLVAVIVAAVMTVVQPPGRAPYQPPRAAGGRMIADFSIALERHLERLRPIPGNGGENPEGPGGGELEKFLALAYPAEDITLAQIETAQADAARLHGKPFPTGKGRPGTWVTGPAAEAMSAS